MTNSARETCNYPPLGVLSARHLSLNPREETQPDGKEEQRACKTVGNMTSLPVQRIYNNKKRNAFGTSFPSPGERNKICLNFFLLINVTKKTQPANYQNPDQLAAWRRLHNAGIKTTARSQTANVVVILLIS